MAHSAFSTAFIVDPSNRFRYGRRDMEVLASNNPQSLLFDYEAYDNRPSSSRIPTKRTSVVNNLAFENLFNNKIYENVLQTIIDKHTSSCFCALHVVRFGFARNNPIVIHLLVENSSITSEEALSLVCTIESTVQLAGWLDSNEKIFIDICQTLDYHSLNRAANDNDKDRRLDCLLDHYRFAYDHTPPFPGSSIGPKSKPNCSGTLAGYIQHGDDFFALTNEHVVNGNGSVILGSEKPYKYKEPEFKFEMCIPSVGDDLQVKSTLEAKLERSRGCQTNMKGRENAITITEEQLKLVKSYNQHIGYVFATSGVDVREKESRFDWAISRCSFETPPLNLHRRNDPQKVTSEFLKIVPDLKDEVEDDNWVTKATDHFTCSDVVRFGTLRTADPQRNEVCMKPPSRTSQWKVAVYNGIRATIKATNGVLTTEHVFCTPGASDHVSAPGDSGSLVIDRDFNVMGMIWGCDQDNTAFRDLSYVSLLNPVLRDIERRNGWEPGSAKLC